jgi:PAS domain S-box-containing protein
VETTSFNLLLVDDRQENLVALQAILRSPQYRLISVTSGNVALQIAMREPVAVILLDVVMPEMDGFEVARHLKQVERTRNIPILFLTGLATQVQQIYRAYDVGAVDYLIKPLDAEVVRRKVAVYVDLVRQRQEIERQARLLHETERREYELRLGELRMASDRRYRKLIDGIAHAVGWSADGETLQLSFISRRAEAVLGYRRDQLAEPDFWEKRLHPEDRESVLSLFRRAAAEGLDLACDHRLIAADGRELWFHTCVSGEKRHAGEHSQVDGVSMDVTELKRAEATQTLLADVSNILASSLDVRTTLTQLARRVVPHLADWCVIDEVVGPSVVSQLAAAHVDWLRPLERRPILEPFVAGGIGDVLRSGRAEAHPEVRDALWFSDAIGAADGDLLGLMGAVSCMFVPIATRGRTLAVATFVSSIAQRRFDPADLELAEDVCHRAAIAMDNERLLEEARRAAQAREELLAIVSHDLRSPLGSIKISARLLEQQPASATNTQRFVNGILRSCDRMERLINDLLDFARIQAGQLTIERHAVDAAALVHDGLELVQPLADQKGVRVEGRVRDHLEADCDRDRALQIIANLLGNAVKFTPEDGSVAVRAERAGDEVLFAVSDSGPGIPEEQLLHIWESYWQGDRKDKAGVGLGLAIAKGLVEAQGGRIWVESQIGIGSTFFFTLPIFRAGVTAVEPSPATP